MNSRLSNTAALQLRTAIKEANGVEIFAIGTIEDGRVVSVQVTCRGQAHRVVALIDRPAAGQVVIHNHPGGNLTPSDADMQLASVYGQDGVGFIIIDSDARRANWVVEPHQRTLVAVSPADVLTLFHTVLPKHIEGFEERPGQVRMALQITSSLNDDKAVICEAGTGTGKSLAYLIPAGLWAPLNEDKVIISTYTKALQAQIITGDIPKLKRLIPDIRAAVILGRSNYLCRRRLSLHHPENPKDDEAFQTLVDWASTSSDGLKTSFPGVLPTALWEAVSSDTDLSLKARCPHFDRCFYYKATRAAASAHIVIVNHSLLLADLTIRATGGHGLLPKFSRLIIDEAHHLERAATSFLGKRTGTRAIRRAVSQLLPRKKRGGALNALVSKLTGLHSHLKADELLTLQQLITDATSLCSLTRELAPTLLNRLAYDGLSKDTTFLRLDPTTQRSELWTETLRPTVIQLAVSLEIAGEALFKIIQLIGDRAIPEKKREPLLLIKRSLRLLQGHATNLRELTAETDNSVRWIEAKEDRRFGWVAEATVSPIEVAPTLETILWKRLPATSATSATLSINGHFTHWRTRVGIRDAEETVFPSPFNHTEQALLALPKDLPAPLNSGFLPASAQLILEALIISQGGAFVLCTSYRAVRYYENFLRNRLPKHWPLWTQQNNLQEVVHRFRRSSNGVLIGTDSIWEGIDVKGDALRLVIIPKLPFPVPTHPLYAARVELLERRGLDPFKTYSLPECVIRLKQGYGRLIRSQQDRGVVLLLDRRVHDRSYGRVVLHALPKARRLSGRWAAIKGPLEAFYSSKTS